MTGKDTDTKYFDQAAAHWDKENERRRLARAIAGGILSLPLHRDMQAMEYGCGTGLVSLQIAPQVKTLTAIDNSTGMLDVLVQKTAKQKISNIRPLCLDLTRDPYLARFDLIICAMTLHHVTGWHFILKRFADLLPAGGLLAIADFDLKNHRTDPTATGSDTPYGFQRTKFSERLQESGFEEPTARTIHTFSRKDRTGSEKAYSVFLITCRKK